MVCKTRQGRRLVRVETKIAHGSSKRVARELSRLGFSLANTCTIEQGRIRWIPLTYYKSLGSCGRDPEDMYGG